jgi:hypothetical protein
MASGTWSSAPVAHATAKPRPSAAISTVLTPIWLPDRSITLANHVPAPVSATARSMAGIAPAFLRFTRSKPSMGSGWRCLATSAMRAPTRRSISRVGSLVAA